MSKDPPRNSSTLAVEPPSEKFSQTPHWEREVKNKWRLAALTFNRTCERPPHNAVEYGVGTMSKQKARFLRRVSNSHSRIYA